MELSTGAIPLSLQIMNDLVFHPLGLRIVNFSLSKESKEYAACAFTLNEKKIQYRLAKITPTKTGQFVTIWKRNAKGATVPFDISDGIHFIIIAVIKGELAGQFVFPVSALAERGIITQNGKGGKRGIRVYPPWDEATSDQAKKTMSWQLKYFLHGKSKDVIQTRAAEKLFSHI